MWSTTTWGYTIVEWLITFHLHELCIGSCPDPPLSVRARLPESFLMLKGDLGFWQQITKLPLNFLIKVLCHRKHFKNTFYIPAQSMTKLSFEIGQNFDFHLQLWVRGKCKTWTLDWTHGLDCGPIFGLDFGLTRWSVTTISNQLSCQCRCSYPS